MSVTLVTDPSEPGFNSFVSLEEADEYFAGVYFGSSMSWDELAVEGEDGEPDTDTQARLLITASRALSALSWSGTAVGGLAFPRVYTSYFNYEPTTPAFVKTLVCEWAKWLWQEGPNSDEPSDAASIIGVKLGELDVKYGPSTVSASALPSSIMALLAPLSPMYLSIGNKARSMSVSY